MKPQITPKEAVRYGHRLVNVPVLLVMLGWALLSILVAYLTSSLANLSLGLFGPVVAWPVWSWLIPRWRDWVIDQGLQPDDVQDLAVAANLIWPRGSLFERTECRRRNGKRGW